MKAGGRGDLRGKGGGGGMDRISKTLNPDSSNDECSRNCEWNPNGRAIYLLLGMLPRVFGERLGYPRPASSGILDEGS